MLQNDFYKNLIKIGFKRITTCECEKTHYFFIDLPRVRVVITRWSHKKDYALCVRDVKDDNMCNNLPLRVFKKLDEKTIKFIRSFIKSLKDDGNRI